MVCKIQFRVVVGAALLLVALLPRQANAALLVYDQFFVGPGGYLEGDDATGTNVLAGQNPDMGPFYAGGWIQSGGDAQAVKDIGSLVYPMLPTGGGQIRETVQFDCCSFGRSGREIAGGLGGEDRTIYQSFLIDFGNQGTDDPSAFGKRGYEMWNGGIGDAFLTVDLFVNQFAGVNDLRLQVTTASGTQFAEVNGGGLDLDALAGTHMVVLAFDFNGADADVVRMYLDPTSSNEASHTAAAEVSVAASDLFITHHGAISNFVFSGGGHVPGAFDEVRWGDTFADVTPFEDPRPVPEPGTLGVLAVGLAGVVLARRRRR